MIYNFKKDIGDKGRLNHAEAQASCDQDSVAAGFLDVGFLNLPMPRSSAENQIYLDLFNPKHMWLDIVEVMPRTSPRKWVFRDGTPVTWFNWSPGNPDNFDDRNENAIMMYGKTMEGFEAAEWNDSNEENIRGVACTYFLPAGAEKTCTWLREFQN